MSGILMGNGIPPIGFAKKAKVAAEKVMCPLYPGVECSAPETRQLMSSVDCSDAGRCIPGAFFPEEFIKEANKRIH